MDLLKILRYPNFTFSFHDISLSTIQYKYGLFTFSFLPVWIVFNFLLFRKINHGFQSQNLESRIFLFL